jgi:hypothetical protein
MTTNNLPGYHPMVTIMEVYIVSSDRIPIHVGGSHITEQLILEILIL